MNQEVQSLHDHIRLEAYLLSERAGHPAHMDQIFWTQAEAIVHGRSAVVTGTGEAVIPKAKTRALKARPATAAKSTAQAPKQPVARKTASAPLLFAPADLASEGDSQPAAEKTAPIAPDALPPKAKAAPRRKRGK